MIKIIPLSSAENPRNLGVFSGGEVLRCSVVRGEFHQRLRATLADAVQRRVCKQETLAAALEKDQTTISKYLNDKVGTLDLDEADIALRHIGSSLADFLAGQPAQPLTAIDQLARTLASKRLLLPWVEGLLRVPEKQLPGVLALIDVGVRAGTGKAVIGRTESPSAPTAARRTARGSMRRPRAPEEA